MYEALCRHLRSLAKLWGVSTPNEAADAIEKMSKRIDFLMNCIYEAEDSLDRGADNDWARAALEKAERGQDDV